MNVVSFHCLFVPDSMTATPNWSEQGWVLLQLLLIFFSHAEESVCRKRGDPDNPQLSKEGDIMLGAVYPFHTSWKDRKETYMQKPLPLECIG